MIAEPIAFVNRASSGRAKPPRVMAEHPNLGTVELYLKSPAFHEKKSPYVVEREWMAAKLAEALALPCALGVPVRITKEFIDTVPDAVLATQLERGPEVLFGSQSAGPGWSVWTQSAPIPRKLLREVTQTYLFDTVIQNWDRCIHNPNMLVKGGDFLLIDHEEAFVAATGTQLDQDFSPLPWLPNSIYNCSGEDLLHPFWKKLTPRSLVDFDAAAQAWKNLPDDLNCINASLAPSCWHVDAMNNIADYLGEATQQIDAIVSQVKQNFEP